MQEPKHIFFYGTLMSRQCREQRSGVTLIDTDTIKGKMYNVGAFPGVILDDDSIVKGEVWSIDDPEIMHSFDAIEGYREGNPESSLYTRHAIRTEGGVDVWVYQYNRSTGNLPVIESGDWRERDD